MLGRTVLLSLFTCIFAKGDDCIKCRQTQIHHMSSADCYRKDLREVPQCFKGNIEVLELSYNRIRKITVNDLNRYTNLKILYLSDNMITTIEEEALENKNLLEILDISYNAFTKIPVVIFHLPSLKKLHMSQNQNINIVNDIENSKPITSPLTYLNIAFNELRELPNLGTIPTLFYYNISGNNNVRMNISKFAGICNLKILHNENTTAQFDDPCECWSLQTWLEKRNVQFYPFNCLPKDCDPEISLEDLEIFNECNKIYNEMIKKANMLKIGIPVCIVALVLILILLIIFTVRRKKQKPNLDDKSKMAIQSLL